MNRGISQDAIDDVRARANIVDVIGSFIPLKRGGHGVFKALCPFHQEKTPSFTVNEQKQVFHCFGCGKGGDVFRFVMEKENVDFPNAVHMLAARYGVVIPENTDPRERAAGMARANARERLYALNEAFAVYFERQLHDNPASPGALYIAKRGIPDDVCRKFRIGYSPDSWNAACDYGRSLGYTDAELVESGVVRRHESSGRLYDHFKGRLTFAIWNEQGRVVGFSARVLDADAKVAKYVNTPETPVFKKGQILYALPMARSAMQTQKMAILCEGQLDTIALHRAGFPCAVAPQGTGFTAEQARMLKRYTEKVCLAFDSDGAGQKAIARALELLLPLDFEVRVIAFPGGKDPDELYRNSGAEAISSAVDAARDWLDFAVDYQKKQNDLSSLPARSRAVSAIVELIRLIGNPVTRELYTRACGEKLGVSTESVASALGIAMNRQQRAFNGAGGMAAAHFPGMPDEIPMENKPEVRIGSSTELVLLELVLGYESAARRLVEDWPAATAEDSLAARAVSAVLDATANGEYETAASLVSAMLEETPSPEISRILVDDCRYSEEKASTALTDCCAQLSKERKERKRKALLAKLAAAATPEQKRELLAAIVKL